MNTILHFKNWAPLQEFLRELRHEHPELGRSLVPVLTRPVLVGSMNEPEKSALLDFHAEWVSKNPS